MLRTVKIIVFLFRSVDAPRRSVRASAARRVSLNHGRTVNAITADHEKTKKPEGDHRSMPGSVRREQKAAQDGAGERAQAEKNIHRSDGGGAVADKIICRDGDHYRELHRFADASRGEVNEHVRKSACQNRERRARGKNSDSEEQHRLAGKTREEKAGRQSRDRQAQRKNRGEKPGVGKREAVLHANVVSQKREKLTVRRIHAVGEKQDAVHRDGSGACACFAGCGIHLSRGYLFANLFYPFLIWSQNGKAPGNDAPSMPVMQLKFKRTSG